MAIKSLNVPKRYDWPERFTVGMPNTADTINEVMITLNLGTQMIQ